MLPDVTCHQRGGEVWPRWLGNTCRSVVNKCDFHHGLEDAILDSVCLVAVLDLLIEVLVQSLGLVTPEGTMEVRFASLLGRGQ